VEAKMKNRLESSEPIYWTLDEVAKWIDPPGIIPRPARILKALQAGHICASGRRLDYESDIYFDELKLLRREIIPTFIWADLIIAQHDLGDNVLCVLEAHNKRWRPAWREVLIERDQVLAFWGQKSSPSVRDSARPIRSIAIDAGTNDSSANPDIEPTMAKNRSGRKWMRRAIQKAYSELFPSGWIQINMSSQDRNDLIFAHLSDKQEIRNRPHTRTIERAIDEILRKGPAA
jgi:hypothetical protein